MITLCTLFNTNYLDKGLALYESLKNVSKDFILYVLAMDDKCYKILVDLNLPHLKPIKLVDFENEELLKVKSTRSIGEYCWTCSSNLIKYIITTYNPEYCTYIDADIYFYSDPYKIIEEMKSKNASVQVIGHRFNKYEAKELEYIVGKYCVEFNTFKNDTNGLKLLDKWCKQCLEYCKIDGDGIHWADQKYQDKWCEDYDYCIETEHLGAGIAPWNITQYKLIKSEKNVFSIKIKNQLYPVIFYHFENIQYLNKNTIKINLYKKWGIDDELVNQLYYPYLKKVDKHKDFIKSKYGLDILIKHHPGVESPKAKRGINICKIFKLWKILTPKYFNKYFMNEFPSFIYRKKDIISI